MNKSIIFAVASILAVLSYTQFAKNSQTVDPAVPEKIATMFQNWLAHHGKSYQTPQEMIHRMKIFYENYLYITEMNEKHSGLTLGLNHFADLHVDEFYTKKQTEEEIQKERDEEYKQKMEEIKNRKPDVELEQQPGPPNFVNYEYTQGGYPRQVLPVDIGSQDNKCWGAVFAWAAQYAITANHAINNNVQPNNLSAQWLLDCYRYGRPYSCGDKISNSDFFRTLYQEKLQLQSTYPGARTGTPGRCAARVSEQVGQQPANVPYVYDYDKNALSDKKLEIAVSKGVTMARLYMNKKLVQFYQNGVVTNSACDEGWGSDKGYFTVAITGYTRGNSVSGQFGQQPVRNSFWQTRWAYGRNYGVYGSMWVQKDNGSTSSYGPCEVHWETWFPYLKKY